MPPAQRRARHRSGVERGLATVLAEIDEIARATLQSISIATMLKLIQRQQRRVAAATGARAAAFPAYFPAGAAPAFTALITFSVMSTRWLA